MIIDKIKQLRNLILGQVFQHFGYTVSKIQAARPKFKSRFEYQRKFIDFNIPRNSQVLDIGSGHDPFPHATILAEQHLETSEHRYDPFKSDGKPVVICDIHHLPFQNQGFDYVFCSHVLEHVDYPIQAANEIMRVGKRGYIETPHFLTDALFSWADGMHKWFVQSIGNRLVFFEYDQRRSQGIQSSAWRDVIFGPYYHPLQDAFFDNKDIFTTMLPWDGHFRVDVYYCAGDVVSNDSK